MVYSGMGPDYRLLIRRARKMAQVDTFDVQSGWKMSNFPSLGLLSYVPRDHPHGAVGVQGGAGYAGVHPVWWGKYCHECNLNLTSLYHYLSSGEAFWSLSPDLWMG